MQMGSGSSKVSSTAKAASRGGTERFGVEIGVTADGVAAFSSHYKSMNAGDVCSMSSYDERGHYCGYKWQCVEFARRYLLQTQDVSFASIGNAYQIFRVEAFSSLGLSSAGKSVLRHDVPVLKVPNGEKPRRIDWDVHEAADALAQAMPVDLLAPAPRPGDVLLWHPAGFFRGTGHVAIIVGVQRAEGTGEVVLVEIAEQNVHHRSWGGKPHARELRVLRSADGHYAIHDPLPGAEVLGWVRPLPASAAAGAGRRPPRSEARPLA